MTFYILLALTLLLALVTILPISRLEVWWVRVLDFPRLQFLVLALVLLVLQLSLLDLSSLSSWVQVGVISTCVAYHAWWVIPYSPMFPVEVKDSVDKNPDNLVRILTANVLTPNRNSQSLIKLVRGHSPDILVTLESDQWWQDALSELESDYCHSMKCPLDNLYGMHVYSRLPLTDCAIDYLVEPDVPSMHALVSLPSGRKIRAHFLHPAPPSPTENDESAERDAELIMVAKKAAKSDLSVIVTGDLNDVAWSATTRLFRKISGLLDPRVGRGMFNTFHAKYWPARWPLDHIFFSRDFTLSSMLRLPKFGSDHFAILTELVLEPGEHDADVGLDADSEDAAWANEKLDP